MMLLHITLYFPLAGTANPDFGISSHQSAKMRDLKNPARKPTGGLFIARFLQVHLRQIFDLVDVGKSHELRVELP